MRRESENKGQMLSGAHITNHDGRHAGCDRRLDVLGSVRSFSSHSTGLQGALDRHHDRVFRSCSREPEQHKTKRKRRTFPPFHLVDFILQPTRTHQDKLQTAVVLAVLILQAGVDLFR
jgi:hypothetical protein